MNWIGVDLDGTLAYYDSWKGIDHIGEPIPAMLEKVKKWLSEGKIVKIFTARVAEGQEQIAIIQEWLKKNGIEGLEITNKKDSNMIELWDDRCKQVITNEGISLEEKYDNRNNRKEA